MSCRVVSCCVVVLCGVVCCGVLCYVMLCYVKVYFIIIFTRPISQNIVPLVEAVDVVELADTNDPGTNENQGLFDCHVY